MKPDAALAKAARDLRSARLLLADGDTNGAANRAYYAMFHAATAALRARGVRLPKPHSQVLGSFSRHFVKEGPIPATVGRALQVGEQLRYNADYREQPVRKEDVEKVLGAAEKFIDSVRARIFG